MIRNTFNIDQGKSILGIFLFLFSTTLFVQKNISVFNGNESPMLEFAFADLRNELSSQGIAITKQDLNK